MAGLYKSRGDYARAEPVFQQAIAIRKKTSGENHPRYADCLSRLAEMYQAQGQYAHAEDLFRQSSAIYQKARGAAHPDYAKSLQTLALEYACSHEPAKGVRPQAEALAIIRKLTDLTASAQSERQQLSTLDRLRKYLNGYLSLTAQAGTPGEEVYPEILAWKGAVSARQQVIRRLRRAAPGQASAESSEIAKLIDELERTTRALSTLARAVYDPKKQDEHQRQMDSLSEEVERLERELAKRSAAFRKTYAERRRTPDDLRKALGPNAALVDFLEYRQFQPPPPGPHKESWDPHFVAFIVRRDRPVVRVELGLTGPIADAVDRWRQSFGTASRGASAPGADLRRLVWEPLAPHLKGAKTILVSPDGALDRFPFAAMPGQEPGTYLIEEAAVAIVPLPRMIPELLAESRPRDDPSLLLVGDVAFDGAASGGEAVAAGEARSAPRGTSAHAIIRWPPLPGTRSEILAIKDSFERRFRHARVKDLREDEPTEEEVRKDAPAYRYLHFATHGFFAPAGLGRMPDAAPTGESCGCSLLQKKDILGFHPGLLSGLVLAGANQPVDPNRDDGILTALEVEELDLSGVELATLSACQTGLGETAGGEGLLGLQRAFQVAGARSVVATLWQVSDTAGRALMTDFYDNLWRKKMPKLEALRQAQLTMLREGVHRGLVLDEEHPADSSRRTPPFYWATYELSGDWR